MYQYLFESLFSTLCFIPRDGIAGSYGNFMFSFLRICQNVLHRCWTIIHSNQQCMRVPVSLHPSSAHCFYLKNLLLKYLKIIAFPISVKWYLIVVLIFLSLMTSDVGYFFICLLAFVYIPWGNVRSCPLPIF